MPATRRISAQYFEGLHPRRRHFSHLKFVCGETTTLTVGCVRLTGGAPSRCAATAQERDDWQEGPPQTKSQRRPNQWEPGLRALPEAPSHDALPLSFLVPSTSINLFGFCTLLHLLRVCYEHDHGFLGHVAIFFSPNDPTESHTDVRLSLSPNPPLAKPAGSTPLSCPKDPGVSNEEDTGRPGRDLESQSTNRIPSAKLKTNRQCRQHHQPQWALVPILQTSAGEHQHVRPCAGQPPVRMFPAASPSPLCPARDRRCFRRAPRSPNPNSMTPCTIAQMMRFPCL